MIHNQIYGRITNKIKKWLPIRERNGVLREEDRIKEARLL